MLHKQDQIFKEDFDSKIFFEDYHQTKYHDVDNIYEAFDKFKNYYFDNFDNIELKDEYQEVLEELVEKAKQTLDEIADNKSKLR